MSKDFFRKQMKDYRSHLSVERRNKQSEAIKMRLLDLDIYKESKTLHSFVSFNDEVDTKEIINYSLDNNKEVYIPRTYKGGLIFHRIYDLESLNPSKFGVLEPDEGFEEDLRMEKDHTQRLMIMPGLAFDKRGNRIGYGAGFYDSYLSKNKEGFITVAIAFEKQVVEYIKAEEHDVKVDMIITPNEIIKCSEHNNLGGN